MVDVAEPSDEYSVAEFQRVARTALESARERNVSLIITGGSGLHFRAVVDPLEFPPTDPLIRAQVDALAADEAIEELEAADPDAGVHVDLANPRRVQRAVEILRLGGDPPSIRARGEYARAVREYHSEFEFIALGVDPASDVRVRAAARLEVMLRDGLLDEIAGLESQLGRNARQAVGYKELLPVVLGKLDVVDGQQKAENATVSLARRQRTFFKRDPRIQWLPWIDDAASRYDSAVQVLERAPHWTS